ncbi:unnamed protein product [Fusarium graminearum]|nr:unnamed protein product [Fusarium graminearum]
MDVGSPERLSLPSYTQGEAIGQFCKKLTTRGPSMNSGNFERLLVHCGDLTIDCTALIKVTNNNRKHNYYNFNYKDEDNDMENGNELRMNDECMGLD